MYGNPLILLRRPATIVSMVVGAAVIGSVLIAPGAGPALGQPTTAVPPPTGVPTTGTRDAVYAEPPPVIPPPPVGIAPPLSAEARQRRARIAARAGEVVVTIGEIEDHLEQSTGVDRDAFLTPAGRRGVVERLLRRHLLAAEAERRGAADPLLSRRARRAEERALRGLLELEIRRDPGEIPPPSEPVDHAEQRYAVVLHADSREHLATWAQGIAAERTSYTQALASANELGRGIETPYGEIETPPEMTPPIEPPVWRALFAIERTGTTSPAISLGGGQFAMVYFAGRITAFVDSGPDEGARRMIAGDRAWQEVITQVREDRVRAFDPSAIDGVAFRMPPGRSLESMERLAEEVAGVQARLAAGQAEGEL